MLRILARVAALSRPLYLWHLYHWITDLLWFISYCSQTPEAGLVQIMHIGNCEGHFPEVLSAAWNVSVFGVGLHCTGLLSTDVDVRIQMNVSRASSVLILDIRRKKACLRGTSVIVSLKRSLNNVS